MFVLTLCVLNGEFGPRLWHSVAVTAQFVFVDLSPLLPTGFASLNHSANEIKHKIGTARNEVILDAKRTI